MYNEENYDNYEDEDTEEEQGSGSKIREIYENNKKLIWVLGIIIVLIIIASIFNGRGGGSSDDNSVVGPINRPERVQVSKSKELKIKVRGKEYTGSYDRISWSSRNKNIADVDSSGIITGNSIGKTVINGIYTEDNTPYTFTVDVVVFNGSDKVKLQGVDFNGRSLVMNTVVPGFSLSDKLNVMPEDGYVYDIKYSSSNPSVVNVDDAGIVRGLGEGKSTITASVNDDSKEAIIDVYVSDDYLDSELIKVPEKIEFEDGQTLKVGLNESKELKLSLSPSDASNKYIKWKSSDETIAAVSADGMVSGVKLGTATVVATALNGKEGKIVIEVVESTVEIDSISIVPSSITMKVGESKTILPTVKPDNASNKGLIFESSNPSSVTVVPTSTKTSATIYANSSGSAVITVKSDNGKVATLTVSVGGQGGNNPGPSSGPSTDTGSLKLRLSNKEVSDKELNKSCNGAIEYYKGPVTIHVEKYRGDVTHIAFCYTKGCTPNKNIKYPLPHDIEIPNGGTYILRIKKYNSNGDEIPSSNSGNYVDGSLVYFINTKQSGLSCTSISSWESGTATTTTTTTKGACYVNTSTQGVGNSFIWKDAGSTVSVYNNYAETVITTKENCERAANNAGGTKNLCFQKGNNYYFGSQYAVKKAYPGNVYVTSIVTKDKCASSNGDLSNIVIGGAPTVSVEVGKSRVVTITLTPSNVSQDVTITSSNTSIFEVDKSSTKSSTSVTIRGKAAGEAKLTVTGNNGKKAEISVDVYSSSPTPTPAKTTPSVSINTTSTSIEAGKCKTIMASASVTGKFTVHSSNNSNVYLKNTSNNVFRISSPNAKVGVDICGTDGMADVEFDFTPDDTSKYNKNNVTCHVTVYNEI